MKEATKIKNRINDLIKKIKYHEHNFHVLGQNTVEESLYDSWRKELENLEYSFPSLINSDSPSFYIGEAPKGKKIKRSIPMLSLKHSYSKNEIERFCNSLSKTMIIEPKVDGVALSVVYKNGRIESVSLRGSGEEGEDISHLAEFIHDLPFYCSENIEVRGEAYLPKNISCDNRRNFVAGYLRKKAPQPSQIHFIAYKIICSLKTQIECLEHMKSLGFEIVPFKISEPEEVLKNSEEFKEFNFETDGVVIKVNDLSLDLGRTARYAKDAIAYKFSYAGKKTTIREISWNISKIGVLVPTCIFDIIDFNGCKISRCHGHNKKNLELKKIGTGATVSVVRIGNIIPYIEQVIEEGNQVKLIQCPFCFCSISETEINYICKNNECYGIRKAKFIYFFEKLQIEGLGDKLIGRFFKPEQEFWTVIFETIQTLKGEEWILNKNDQKVFKNFNEKRKYLTLEKIIIAVSIEGIATEAQLSKIKLSEGKLYNNLQCFLDKNSEKLYRILHELINP